MEFIEDRKIFKAIAESHKSILEIHDRKSSMDDQDYKYEFQSRLKGDRISPLQKKVRSRTPTRQTVSKKERAEELNVELKVIKEGEEISVWREEDIEIEDHLLITPPTRSSGKDIDKERDKDRETNNHQVTTTSEIANIRETPREEILKLIPSTQIPNIVFQRILETQSLQQNLLSGITSLLMGGAQLIYSKHR